METIIYPILTTALAIAVVTDLKEQRIPNVLTFPLMLAGLVIHGLLSGMDGLTFAGLGLLVGFGVMLVPYCFGVMGAGDVKMMAAVGAMLGTSGVLHAFIFTSLAGGVYATVVLMRHWSTFVAILSRFKQTILSSFGTKELVYVPVTVGNGNPPANAPQLPRLCYGVAIAAGTFFTIAAGFGVPAALPFLQAAILQTT